jgi:glycosyltransferase involved in cell wall biosynthesis
MLTETKKDLFLLVLLVVSSIIVFTIWIYAVVDTVNIKKTKEQEKLDQLFKDRFPTISVQDDMLLTNDRQVILPDPSGEIFRIKHEYKRVGRLLKFANVDQINNELYKLLEGNRYPYQKDIWNCVFFWRKIDAQPRFSIVLPVFNQQEIIQKNLLSIFKHTKDEFEIFIIIDGSTDQTLGKVLAFCQEQITTTPTNNCAIFVIEIKQSVFETQCDNIGFKLSSSPNVLEIQADMTMTQPGYNLILEKPFLHFNDICGISARCAHSKDVFNAVGFPTNVIQAHPCQWNDPNIFYLLPTCNRGPILFDRDKLQDLGFLDDNRFCIENDDHEYFTRAYNQRGYRCGFIHIMFETAIQDGTTRKPMAPDQKEIRAMRRSGKNYKMPKLPEVLTPHFRTIDPGLVLMDSKYKIDRTFGKEVLAATFVQFANTNSIHYHNATLAHMAHFTYRIRFEASKLYTEFDVQDFIQTKAPPDVQRMKHGYHGWIWKPYIMLKALQESRQDSVIVYADSGLFFKNQVLLSHYIKETQKKGYCFFDLWHDMATFTKCNAEQEISDPQIKKNLSCTLMTDASLIMIKNTPEMISFLQEWLDLCLKPFLLSDEVSGTCKNNPAYKEHRQDQTLLSIVILNRGMKTVGKCIQKEEELTVHHRIRTKEDFKFFWKKVCLDNRALSILD